MGAIQALPAMCSLRCLTLAVVARPGASMPPKYSLDELCGDLMRDFKWDGPDTASERLVITCKAVPVNV